MDNFLIGLISAIVSTIVTTIVGLVVKKSVEKRFDRKEAVRTELEKLQEEKRRQERKEDVLQTLHEELKPLIDKVDNMQKKVDNMQKALNLDVEGTVTQLREFMKLSRDRFVEQGYISASDYASWHELYSTYKKLGGNHFREYVDAWKDDVESLQREPAVNI